MKPAGLYSMLGPVTDDTMAQVNAYLDNPTTDGWDDISGIIVGKFPTETIWQCVVALDPDFPRRGRATDEKGNMVREWERIPHPFTVRKALKLARQSFKADAT